MPNNFLSAEFVVALLKVITDHVESQSKLITFLERENEELKNDILQFMPPAPWEPPPKPRHTAFVPAEQGEQQAPQSEPPRHQGRPRPGF